MNIFILIFILNTVRCCCYTDTFGNWHFQMALNDYGKYTKIISKNSCTCIIFVIEVKFLKLVITERRR